MYPVIRGGGQLSLHKLYLLPPLRGTPLPDYEFFGGRRGEGQGKGKGGIGVGDGVGRLRGALCCSLAFLESPSDPQNPVPYLKNEVKMVSRGPGNELNDRA